jgi:hypothetical protein
VGADRLSLQRAGSTVDGATAWRRRPTVLGCAAAEAAGPAQKVAAMLPYCFVLRFLTVLGREYQNEKKLRGEKNIVIASLRWPMAMALAKPAESRTPLDAVRFHGSGYPDRQIRCGRGPRTPRAGPQVEAGKTATSAGRDRLEPSRPLPHDSRSLRSHISSASSSSCSTKRHGGPRAVRHQGGCDTAVHVRHQRGSGCWQW